MAKNCSNLFSNGYIHSWIAKFIKLLSNRKFPNGRGRSRNEEGIQIFFLLLFLTLLQLIVANLPNWWNFDNLTKKAIFDQKNVSKRQFWGIESKIFRDKKPFVPSELVVGTRTTCSPSLSPSPSCASLVESNFNSFGTRFNIDHYDDLL